MPSYRVTLAIGALATGTAPDAVLPAASALVREHAVVEAEDVRLLRGVPCAVVRFEAEDDRVAAAVREAAVDGLRDVVEIRSDVVTRREGGRWIPVA
ncbi:hypothetical protein DEJ17_05180 [Curtobacterium sp. MCSS17_011]|uniref:hypothetical protein n=1 Tax=Curtobacterium sp. MCSS17_011 TaxID=2175643 RepID=UPI000D8C5B04|nr:hypothetical protein [Curtobacterium sp. MCSS17_011]PYY60566.1 hypothetical protein DEJ17_05180 [Curtobacterium sp. MCSS17_011]